MPSIPDDGTMDAALYGSAHIETLLSKGDGERISAVLRDRIDAALAGLDLGIADVVMASVPMVVESDEPLDRDAWPEDVADTIETLRDIDRWMRALRLVGSWVEDADRRGRMIGLGEHSARVSVSGRADDDYKAAVLRGGMG